MQHLSRLKSIKGSRWPTRSCSRYFKKRADSVELYLKGAREDLAKKEQSEIELIKAYLPAQLSDDELKEKIKSIIEKVGKNLGAVMKMAKDEIGASAEAKRISMIAKELLN